MKSWLCGLRLAVDADSLDGLLITGGVLAQILEYKNHPNGWFLVFGAIEDAESRARKTGWWHIYSRQCLEIGEMTFLCYDHL